MKFTLIIDKEREEEVVIYAHGKSDFTEAIEKMISAEDRLMAYNGKEMIPISPSQVYCFIAEDNKVYAVTEKEKLQIKARLYNIEEALPPDFIRINKSSIANIKMIDRFDASVYGTLQVKFKNGYIDYVSRRNLKNIKERLGV